MIINLPIKIWERPIPVPLLGSLLVARYCWNPTLVSGADRNLHAGGQQMKWEGWGGGQGEGAGGSADHPQTIPGASERDRIIANKASSKERLLLHCGSSTDVFGKESIFFSKL